MESHDPTQREGVGELRPPDGDGQDSAARLRASDAEREQAVDRLKVAATEGRLTLEELANRTEAAYNATARGELERVVADLPAAPAHAATRAEIRRNFVGIMSRDTIRGPIRLADRSTIVSMMGGVDLDLSQATIEGGELTLLIFSIMGGSTIRVPPGVHVERSGFSLMGGDRVELPVGTPPPDAPTIYIRSYNLMGGNWIRPPKRRRFRLRG